MSRFLGMLFTLGYLALCFWTLAYWLPNFFAVNVAYTPEFTYRYLFATGLPFGLLLVTVIARQALKGYFSITMLFQVLVAGTLLYAGTYSFYYPKQANFFCPAHLFVCGAGIVWNLYQHRKELDRYNRAAMAAA